MKHLWPSMRPRADFETRSLSLSAGFLALAVLCPDGLAQAPETSGHEQEAGRDANGNVTVYEPSFFDRFRPSNALDIVFRIPGFDFEGGSSARGFAGTAGNVLLDGRRPPTRGDSLYAILSRIPVSAIARIEIVRGGAPGIDMQGLPVVANIVRRTGAASSIVLSAGLNAASTGGAGGNGQVQYRERTEERLIEASLSASLNERDRNSMRTRTAPSGAVILDGRTTSDNRSESLSGTASLEQRAFGGDIRINLLAEQQTFDRDSIETLLTPGGEQIQSGENRNRSGELGLRYSLSALSGELEFAALQSVDTNRSGSQFDTASFTSSGERKEHKGESILRASYRSDRLGEWAYEADVETVYNWVRSRNDRILNNAPFVLAGDDFEVSEWRSEANVGTTWTPSTSLSLELALRYERSEITASGSAGGGGKSLGYVKPRLNVAWSPSTDEQVNIRVQRVVDQLSFSGFASSASFENEVFGVGNPDIEPEKTWRSEVRYERRFGGQSSIVLELGRSEIEDELGRALVTTGSGTSQRTFEVTRNTGSAVRQYITLESQVELDAIGFNGMILRLAGSLRDSETTDPVTGVKRGLDGISPARWDVSLQQTLDNGALRWSLSFKDEGDRPSFSPRSIGERAGLTTVDANITWRPSAEWSLSAGIQNMTGARERGWSEFYAAPRNTGAPAYLEADSTDTGQTLSVSLRRTL